MVSNVERVYHQLLGTALGRKPYRHIVVNSRLATKTSVRIFIGQPQPAAPRAPDSPRKTAQKNPVARTAARLY